jgi:hypothetical protein
MYASADDLRTMQSLVQEAWRLAGPKNERHVGDVAWAVPKQLYESVGFRQHSRSIEFRRAPPGTSA